MKLMVFVFIILPCFLVAQTKWQNVDSLYQPLPSGFHVFYSNDPLDSKPFIAYYVVANLKDKSINYTTQIAAGKRYTPNEYYQKYAHPLLVMNATFFEFIHNQNLNVVVKDGKMEAYNRSIEGRGKDTFTYRHPFSSAIGITKNRKADIAWIFTDSTRAFPYASQRPINAFKDSNRVANLRSAQQAASLKEWKVQTAVGGGPVLLQKGEIKITNNEELRFSGNGIEDKHPRTAMGYTKDNKLIMLVIQGRFPGKAEGATLLQEAKIFKDLGCIEALNLDGGGSSCLLINGKQTITPSDKEGQRPIPAIFMIESANKLL